MLLICQSSPALVSGSQPSFRATVAVGGSPAATPQRCDGVTCSISPSANACCVPESRALGCSNSRNRAIWSDAVVVLSPQPGQGKPGQATHPDAVVCVRPTEWL